MPAMISGIVLDAWNTETASFQSFAFGVNLWGDGPMIYPLSYIGIREPGCVEVRGRRRT